VHRSTAFVRRACAVGTATALIGLTTGFGVMTATTAYAADAPVDTAATAPAVSGGDTSTSTAPGLPTDAGTGAGTPTSTGTGTATSASADPTSTAPTDTAPTGTAPAATPAPTTGGTTTGGTPTTAAPTAAAPAAAPAASATPTVTIVGKAQVGQRLEADPAGFTEDNNLSYRWTVGGATKGQGPAYSITAEDAGKTVSVTVRNTLPGHTDETATATTADVTELPVFVDAAGKPVVGGTVADEDSLPLEATAGEAFSYTFRTAGSPAPKLALAWYYGDDEGDSGDPEDTPAAQLPKGVGFDPETGVLSVDTDEANPYIDFAVTATNSAGSTTQYVELSVVAGAPVGVEVFAADRQQFMDFLEAGSGMGFSVGAQFSSSAVKAADATERDAAPRDGKFRSWIIDRRGAITTIDTTYSSDEDGSGFSDIETPGGTPTVQQGGMLITSGGLVDEFGNDVTDEDAMPAPVAFSSNVASDVISADPLFGGAGNFTDITFTDASTHTLTATGDAFSTSFPVRVVPTATAPVATPPVVTPPVAAAPIGTVPVRTAAHGRLAYTGTDATDSLPWALGMLAAGAALVGLRFARRRAQR